MAWQDHLVTKKTKFRLIEYTFDDNQTKPLWYVKCRVFRFWFNLFTSPFVSKDIQDTLAMPRRSFYHYLSELIDKHFFEQTQTHHKYLTGTLTDIPRIRQATKKANLTRLKKKNNIT